MASISSDPNGTRRILFTRPRDKRRVAIRLGHMSMREARAVMAGVEVLVACAIAGTSMGDETARWVSSVGDRLHGALAEHGLLSARRRVQLGEFLAGYRKRRTDVQGYTQANYGTVTKMLLAFFPAARYIHEITPGDADGWMIYLRSKSYAQATIGKAVKIARQFFRDAVRTGIITDNPFSGIKAPPQTNRDRMAFISNEIVRSVIDAAPDAEWRLIIALSRYGGLRCPSEHRALGWTDVNWETGRVRIDSPKTGERWIPLFPELRPFLEEAFEMAAPGTVHVIAKHRDHTNLGTQLKRIVRKAGCPVWPRIFHNLRASRQTELENKFPGHVVCAWMGNSETVAKAHYLQVTDEHFAAGCARNCAHDIEGNGQIGHANGDRETQKTTVSIRESVVSADSRLLPAGLDHFDATDAGDNGLRPGQKTGGAELCADLLQVTIKAHLQGDVE